MVTIERVESGTLEDTPVGDSVLRRFLHNQADATGHIAGVYGGRLDRFGGVALADTGGPVSFYNQAVLFSPLDSADDARLDRIDDFYARSRYGATLLSAWPTPDLANRGWRLMGHPMFVVRGPGPVPDEHVAPGVEVSMATTPSELAAAEQVVIDGYPIPEVAGSPVGTVLAPALGSGRMVVRTGSLDGTPVGVGCSFTAHGVVNLCMAATLPAARRRGVWQSLVWARVADDPTVPAVAFTSDDSRPGFVRLGFLPVMRFTFWVRTP